MTNTTRRAFTLVELLIVIAIVALLIAMLFPALGKWDELSKGTACQRNLRDIAQLFNSYAGMNEGRYPYLVDTYHGQSFRGDKIARDRWAGFTQVKQLKQAGATAEMWFCPFDSNLEDPDYWQTSSWTTPAFGTTSAYVYTGYTMLIYRGYPYGRYLFTDYRPMPIKDSVADDVPLAADCLRVNRDGGGASGWTHGGGVPDGVYNSDCNTVFKSGAVKLTRKEAFDWNEPSLLVTGAEIAYHQYFALSPKE